MLKIVSDTRDIGERKTIYFLEGFTKPAGRSTLGLSMGHNGTNTMLGDVPGATGAGQRAT